MKQRKREALAKQLEQARLAKLAAIGCRVIPPAQVVIKPWVSKAA